MKGKEIRRWLPTSVLWAGFLLSPAKVISVAQIFFQLQKGKWRENYCVLTVRRKARRSLNPLYTTNSANLKGLSFSYYRVVRFLMFK